MKTIRTILFFALIISLNSCLHNGITWRTDANMRNVELGMTRHQVIGILGERYMIASASTNEYGKKVEVLGYRSAPDEEYKLRFVEGKLVDWTREHVNKYVVPEERNAKK